MKPFAITLGIVLIASLLLAGCRSMQKTNASSEDGVPIDNAKTVISRANAGPPNPTYMITSAEGAVVLLDPVQISLEIEADVITVTHSHSDHYDGSALTKDDAKISMYTLESFQHKGISVKTVASSHGDYPVNTLYPDNIIYIIEVDGLRIAHLGDIGQKELSKEQLKEIGHLDAAFLPCVDLPQYGLTVENSINIIKQLKPSVVFPTHFDLSDEITLSLLQEVFDTTETASGSIAMVKDDLSDGLQKLILLYN